MRVGSFCPTIAFAVLLGAALLALPRSAPATTAMDLSGRILIDGITDEWQPDESVFQMNTSNPGEPVPEESISDSEWGFFNDLNQIRITWDADFLYVAVDAIIWNNNVILLFDTEPGGMTEMTNLNSWRRNFTFQGLRPDLFVATWDGNTLPQAWFWDEARKEVEKFIPESFSTAASFSQGAQGRALEAAIPWTFVLGDSAERVFSTDIGDSVYVLPDDIRDLKFVAVLTAGGDGTGGPDSAPDNLSGHETDGSAAVTIDNWATIPLDRDPVGRRSG